MRSRSRSSRYVHLLREALLIGLMLSLVAVDSSNLMDDTQTTGLRESPSAICLMNVYVIFVVMELNLRFKFRVQISFILLIFHMVAELRLWTHGSSVSSILGITEHIKTTAQPVSMDPYIDSRTMFTASGFFDIAHFLNEVTYRILTTNVEIITLYEISFRPKSSLIPKLKDSEMPQPKDFVFKPLGKNCLRQYDGG